MARALRRALLVLGVLAALDVAFNLTLLADGRFRGRPLPPFGALPHPRQERWLEEKLAELGRGEPEAGLSTFDAELGWTNRRSAAHGDLRTNALGARGTREYAAEPEEGTLRLACFGDSYTYGAEVADGECWTAALEGMDPTLEVLNFGVEGYGTGQALLRFRREGRSGAQIVVVGTLVENVGRNVNRYRPLYYPSSGAPGAKPRLRVADGGLEVVPLPFAGRAELLFAVRDGSVLELLREHEYWRDGEHDWLRFSSFARLVAGYRAYARRQPERMWSEPAGEPFRTTVAILEGFHGEALAAGCERVLVVVFPREKELDALLAGRRYWSALTDALEERGIPWLDAADDLAEAARAGTPVSALYRGGHLSAEGNRVVAGAVRALLR